MLDAFQLPFMQRAALEIALLAPLAGILGAQIVLRRLAFLTHGVGAAAFPGLVLAGPAGVPPALAALGTGGAFAAGREGLRRRSVDSDAATGMTLVAALALGIVLASDAFDSGAEVDGMLFGSLLAIGDGELVATATALGLGLMAAAHSRRTWIAAGFDEPSAPSLGLRPALADVLLLGSIAVASVVALDAVGALLVSAVLVIPAAIASLFARSVRALELGATALALAIGLAGIVLAYEIDLPPGATVATLGGAAFGICLLGRGLAGR